MKGWKDYRLQGAEYVPIDALRPYEHNAKEHPEWQVDQLVESIKTFGMRRRIGVWENPETHELTVTTGHGRLLACQKLGFTEVPIERDSDLNDNERRMWTHTDNQANANSGIDLEILNVDLEEIGIDFDLEALGFETAELEDEQRERFEDWQNRKDEYDEASGSDEEYEDFLKKFEAKKTTDDCYTPEKVYEAVAGWVANEYGIDRRNFVRPFFPGGDYKEYKYAKNSVVVDNPPFSILAEILRFYTERNIKFFLFSPSLTMFSSSSSSSSSSTAIGVGVSITYENKANVSTSFLTNLEDKRIRAKSSPSLYAAVKRANDEAEAEMHADIPKYNYPNEVLTSTMLSKYSKYGIDFSVTTIESEATSALDAQKESGKAIFGKGYLISERAAAERAAAERAAAERAAAERAAAERAAAERAAATKWELSEREKEIVRRLSQNG